MTAFGPLAFILKVRVQGLRDTARFCRSHSFLLLQGIETLHLRLERHSENAVAGAKLDPQGQTIQNALRKIGYADVKAVRQAKYFALRWPMG